MHEWQIIHSVPAHTNNNHLPTPLSRKSRRANTRLDAGALDHARRSKVLPPLPSTAGAKEPPNSTRVASRVERRVDSVREARRDELPCEREAPRLDVGDDERVGTGRPRREERRQADGPGAADDGPAAERQACHPESLEDHAQGLEEGGFGKGHVVWDPTFCRKKTPTRYQFRA